jgi:hypothetical protein
VLEQNSNSHIRVFAVWEPILPTDYSSPSTGVLARLADPRVSQYWDKNHLFAEQLARRLNSEAGHPQPSCCNRRGIQWDEVAVYPQDAHWNGQLPRAVYLDGPVVHALGFANVVAGLLSKPADSKPTSEEFQPMSSIPFAFFCVDQNFNASKLPSLGCDALCRVNCERAPFSALQVFSPNLFACNQLSAGVNRKLKWLVQGGKYRTMTPPCLDS